MSIQLSRWRRIAGIFVLSFVFGACNSGNLQEEGRSRFTALPPTMQSDRPAEGSAGDSTRGAQLFTESIGGLPSCSTCHATDDTVILGPGMAGVGVRAESRADGMSAEDYLHTSIIEPGAYVVEGFQNVMPDVFEQSLSEAQIRDLIAYLLSL